MIHAVSRFLTTQTFSESYASVKGNLTLRVECFFFKSQITHAVETVDMCLCKFLPVNERIIINTQICVTTLFVASKYFDACPPVREII